MNQIIINLAGKVQHFFKYLQSLWNNFIISNLLPVFLCIKDVEPYSIRKLSSNFHHKWLLSNSWITTAEFRINQFYCASQEGENYCSLEYLYYQELLKQSTLEKQMLRDYYNNLRTLKNINIDMYLY